LCGLERAHGGARAKLASGKESSGNSLKRPIQAGHYRVVSSAAKHTVSSIHTNRFVDISDGRMPT